MTMIKNLTKLFFKSLLLLALISFNSYKVFVQDLESALQQLQILQNDIKTLEKAIYSENSTSQDSTFSLSGDESDVLTKHLLKLSDLEEQFKILTNSFEEVNFKLDKLSNRITKIQSDNQIRFQDLEITGVAQTGAKKNKKKNYQEVPKLLI